MKKLISLVLCAIMLLSCIPFSASAEGTDCMFLSCDGVTVTGGVFAEYDSYLKAVKLVSDGTDGSALFDIGSLSGEVYFAVWSPVANGEKVDFSIGAASVEAVSGHKAVTVKAENGAFEFESGKEVTLYVYGASADGDTLLEKANGTLNGYSEEYLDLSEYEVERYTRQFWNEDIVFNESFFPITEPDGSIAPISLMYDVDRVVSVKDSTLSVEYEYGKDYTIENGNLCINPDGAITLHDYNYIFKDNSSDTTSYRKTLDGAYAYCGQKSLYFSGYYNITYTTVDTWDGVIPEKKGNLLPKTLEKLESGDSLKILSIGDSLAGGANASIERNLPPFADIWRDMVPKALQEIYPDADIQYTTIAQGGATAALAIEKMNSILTYSPDLVMIEFGTNECMQGDSAWQEGGYIDTLKDTISAINNALPDTEIILVAPIISNPIFFPEDWFLAYADSLYTLEREGVAVADVTSVYQYTLTKKRYIDNTGDFLCHPGDFGTRFFVQTILRTLAPATDAEYIEGLSERILKYRYKCDYLPEQWSQLEALASEASSAIAECSTAAEAVSEYYNSTIALDAIKTSAEIAGEADIDCENLIFDRDRSMDTVGETLTNCAVRLDTAAPALLATAMSARKPAFTLDFSVGQEKLYAENYEYIVVTLMEPTTNSSKAKATTFTLNCGGNTLAADTVTHIIDGKFHSYIIPLAEKEGFEGEINGINVGVFASAAIGDKVYISSIAFCKTNEEAKDTAVEREKTANKNVASAITYLYSDAETVKSLDMSGEILYIKGDANGNGKTDLKDMWQIRVYLAKGSQVDFAQYADMDGDENITSSDAALLKKVLSGNAKEDAVKLCNGNVSYDAENECAKISLAKNNGKAVCDLEDTGISADMFKYVSVCAKTEMSENLTVKVTVKTESGEMTDTVEFAPGDTFTAATAKFVDLTGNIQSVTFEFEASEGSVIYFDSFVLTPTISSALNAETVRIGAANLI